MNSKRLFTDACSRGRPINRFGWSIRTFCKLPVSAELGSDSGQWLCKPPVFTSQLELLTGGGNHSLEIYTLPCIYILLWVWYSVIQIYLFRYLLLWFRYPVSHKVKDCSFPTVAPSFVGGGNRLSWSCFGIIRIDHLGTMNACKVCANPQMRYGVTKTQTVNFRISKDNQIQ